MLSKIFHQQIWVCRIFPSGNCLAEKLFWGRFLPYYNFCEIFGFRICFRIRFFPLLKLFEGNFWLTIFLGNFSLSSSVYFSFVYFGLKNIFGFSFFGFYEFFYANLGGYNFSFVKFLSLEETKSNVTFSRVIFFPVRVTSQQFFLY